MEYVEYITKLQRIRSLRHSLETSDYKVLKYLEGELSTAEYLEVTSQRRAWREEINTLQAELLAYRKEKWPVVEVD